MLLGMPKPKFKKYTKLSFFPPYLHVHVRIHVCSVVSGDVNCDGLAAVCFTRMKNKWRTLNLLQLSNATGGLGFLKQYIGSPEMRDAISNVCEKEFSLQRSTASDESIRP